MKQEHLLSIITSLIILIVLIILFVWGAINSLRYFAMSEGIINCPMGFCPTNRITGVKDCSRQQVFAQFEVCNQPDTCANPLTPCVYTDTTKGTSCPLDAGYTGFCEIDNCNCSSRVICPEWATTYFEPATTINAGGLPNSINFRQITTWLLPNGQFSSQLPLNFQYSSTTAGSCGLASNNVNLMWPNNCVVGQLGYNEDDQLWYCMNVAEACHPSQTLVRKEGDFVCM